MTRIEGYDECKRNFMGIKRRLVSEILTRTCRDLIEDAVESKGYTGFTGNTQTSYSCGIYIGGKLEYVVSAGDSMSKPVSRKVRKGETMYLQDPYEGRSRRVTGLTDVNDLSGQKTSERFLKTYRDIPKEGFAIVMTTGTEYSVFLEKTLDLSVLGTTRLRARGILMNNVKPVR